MATKEKVESAEKPAKKEPKKAPKQRAVRFDDLMANREGDAASFEFEGHTIGVISSTRLSVPTADGDEVYKRGDYLIVGSSGDLSVCDHNEYKG